MNPTTKSHRPPTAKQLRYLRALAEQTGTSFTTPHSSTEASREICRLRGRRASDGRYVEVPDDHDGERQLIYATAPHPDELSRWGCGRGWQAHSPDLSPAGRARPSVGERMELARYRVAGEERVICGQRIDGVVRVTDRPAAGRGRAYLIERGIEQDGRSALEALVADYLEQARQLEQVPMASSVLRRDLQQVAADA